LCAWLASASLAAQAWAATPEHDAAAFFKTTDYAIADSRRAYSADGSRLLLTANPTGVFNVVALDLRSGALEPLTESASDSAFAISYFPDGKRFLYRSDKGGNELDHVYAAGDGETRDLTPGDKLKAEFIDWIDGGKAFVLATNERDPKFFDLYRYDSGDYRRKLVYRNDLGLDAFAVSRDGRIAAGLKPRTSADDDIYLVRLGADAPPELITKHEGNVSHAIYEFTPESDALVYGTDGHGEFTQAWSHALGNGAKKSLIRENWDVIAVHFSESGRYRVHAVNEDASTTVAIHDRESGAALRLPAGLPRGDLNRIRFSPDEKQLAFVINADNSPSNVFTVEVASGAFRQWTQALNPAIEPADLVTSTVVRYRSYDGREIPGI
ncbi:MAG: S9 family peptidase, partial [Steroidobacteraceae bacterium]